MTWPSGMTVAPPAYTCDVPVSEHDKRYMQKLAEFSAELEREELPPWTEMDRAWFEGWIDERRAARGLPPMEEEDEQRRVRSRPGTPSKLSQ